MAFRLNSSDNYEPIQVTLSKDKTPIAFTEKVDELLEARAFETREEAEAWVSITPITLELYYEKGYGLFAVESEAVNSGTIYSPYSAELGKDAIL